MSYGTEVTCSRSTSVIWHTLGIEPWAQNLQSTLIPIRPRTTVLLCNFHFIMVLLLKKYIQLCRQHFASMKCSSLQFLIFWSGFFSGRTPPLVFLAISTVWSSLKFLYRYFACQSHDFTIALSSLDKFSVMFTLRYRGGCLLVYKSFTAHLLFQQHSQNLPLRTVRSFYNFFDCYITTLNQYLQA